ncbi:hypothetical protein ABPG74_005322 [Tetrahymena malaccensis]
MSKETPTEEQQNQVKKNLIQSCVRLSKFFYKISDSPADQLQGLFISTLPDLVKDESYQNVENALKKRLDIMIDDKNISEKVKTLTRQHVLCIQKMRQYNKESPELLNYSKNLFQELKE